MGSTINKLLEGTSTGYNTLMATAGGAGDKGYIVFKKSGPDSGFGKVGNLDNSKVGGNVITSSEQNRLTKAAVFKAIVTQYGQGGCDGALNIDIENEEGKKAIRALLEKYTSTKKGNPYIEQAFEYLLCEDDASLSSEEMRLLDQFLQKGDGSAKKRPGKGDIESDMNKLKGLKVKNAPKEETVLTESDSKLIAALKNCKDAKVQLYLKLFNLQDKDKTFGGITGKLFAIDGRLCGLLLGQYSVFSKKPALLLDVIKAVLVEAVKTELKGNSNLKPADVDYSTQMSNNMCKLASQLCNNYLKDVQDVRGLKRGLNQYRTEYKFDDGNNDGKIGEEEIKITEKVDGLKESEASGAINDASGVDPAARTFSGVFASREDEGTMRELALMSYGSGWKEKTKGGNGSVGLVTDQRGGQHVIKFNTKSGESSSSPQEEEVRCSNALRAKIIQIVNNSKLTEPEKDQIRTLECLTNQSSVFRRKDAAGIISQIGTMLRQDSTYVWNEVTSGVDMSQYKSGSSSRFKEVQLRTQWASNVLSSPPLHKPNAAKLAELLGIPKKKAENLVLDKADVIPNKSFAYYTYRDRKNGKVKYTVLIDKAGDACNKADYVNSCKKLLQLKEQDSVFGDYKNLLDDISLKEMKLVSRWADLLDAGIKSEGGRGYRRVSSYFAQKLVDALPVARRLADEDNNGQITLQYLYATIGLLSQEEGGKDVFPDESAPDAGVKFAQALYNKLHPDTEWDDGFVPGEEVGKANKGSQRDGSEIKGNEEEIRLENEKKEDKRFEPVKEVKEVSEEKLDKDSFVPSTNSVFNLKSINDANKAMKQNGGNLCWFFSEVNGVRTKADGREYLDGLVSPGGKTVTFYLGPDRTNSVTYSLTDTKRLNEYKDVIVAQSEGQSLDVTDLTPLEICALYHAVQMERRKPVKEQTWKPGQYGEMDTVTKMLGLDPVALTNEENDLLLQKDNVVKNYATVIQNHLENGDVVTFNWVNTHFYTITGIKPKAGGGYALTVRNSTGGVEGSTEMDLETDFLKPWDDYIKSPYVGVSDEVRKQRKASAFYFAKVPPAQGQENVNKEEEIKLAPQPQAEDKNKVNLGNENKIADQAENEPDVKNENKIVSEEEEREPGDEPEIGDENYAENRAMNEVSEEDLTFVNFPLTSTAFDFKTLRGLVNDDVNLGELKIGEDGSLCAINGDYRQPDQNNVKLAPEQNRDVRRKVYCCLKKEYGDKEGAGQRLETVLKLLLNERDRTSSLSRDEVDFLIRMLENNEPGKYDEAHYRALHDYKIGKPVDVSQVAAYVKGLGSKQSEQVQKAAKLVSVNAQQSVVQTILWDNWKRIFRLPRQKNGEISLKEIDNALGVPPSRQQEGTVSSDDVARVISGLLTGYSLTSVEHPRNGMQVPKFEFRTDLAAGGKDWDDFVERAKMFVNAKLAVTLHSPGLQGGQRVQSEMREAIGEGMARNGNLKPYYLMCYRDLPKRSDDAYDYLVTKLGEFYAPNRLLLENSKDKLGKSPALVRRLVPVVISLTMAYYRSRLGQGEKLKDVVSHLDSIDYSRVFHACLERVLATDFETVDELDYRAKTLAAEVVKPSFEIGGGGGTGDGFRYAVSDRQLLRDAGDFKYLADIMSFVDEASTVVHRDPSGYERAEAEFVAAYPELTPLFKKSERLFKSNLSAYYAVVTAIVCKSIRMAIKVKGLTEPQTTDDRALLGKLTSKDVDEQLKLVARKFGDRELKSLDDVNALRKDIENLAPNAKQLAALGKFYSSQTAFVVKPKDLASNRFQGAMRNDERNNGFLVVRIRDNKTNKTHMVYLNPDGEFINPKVYDACLELRPHQLHYFSHVSARDLKSVHEMLKIIDKSKKSFADKGIEVGYFEADSADALTVAMLIDALPRARQAQGDDGDISFKNWCAALRIGPGTKVNYAGKDVDVSPENVIQALFDRARKDFLGTDAAKLKPSTPRAAAYGEFVASFLGNEEYSSSLKRNKNGNAS